MNFFKRNSNQFIVYTDGSHKGRIGSWAYVVTLNGEIVAKDTNKVIKTNSLAMELQAVIEAMKAIQIGSTATFYCDSKIVIQCATNKTKRPKADSYQLQLLDQLLSERVIDWKWVRAHSGNHFNEMCDEMCIASRTGLL